MDKYLIAIGCQKEKLQLIDKRVRHNILDYLNAHGHDYDGVIAIVRKATDGDDNFQKNNDLDVSNSMTYLGYEASNIIEVPGYDVDCRMFRKDAEYHLMGVSTSASVLCIAMSMYSCGLRIKVLKDLCEDRKGKKLEDMAFQIMNAYMPGVVI